MSTYTPYLPRLDSRESYMDFLEGYLTLDSGQPAAGRSPLKTYMLETARGERRERSLPKSFSGSIGLETIDEALYKVWDKEHPGEIVGLIEVIEERHPVFYTTFKSDESNKWISKNVDQTPWLDRMWLSSHILSNIWNHTRKVSNPARYVGFGFEHESKYEISDILQYEDYEGIEEIKEIDEGDESPAPDRRKSRVYITERLGVLSDKLERFTNLYDPLHSLVQLQIPSDSQGGHRLYYDGRAINLSDSFLEHRSKIMGIVELYQNLTETAEDKLWLGTTDVGGGGFRMDGEPITIQFEQELSEETFSKFITYGLQRRNSILRIGGYLHHRGPRKIHMSAIDRHLWQPFLLEATTKHIMVLLPRGTCGNTIHRLVTYVQRFISPKISVWLGSESYTDAVGLASERKKNE